jgi:UDP-GlcNAc:undecaprenyl-phosphate/decaprenyl-phosphate GlcNAc-1-phosphate transferase
MRPLPLLFALALAALLAKPLLGLLRAGGHTAPNFRGRELPVPFGLLVPVAALVALVPVLALERLAHAQILEPGTAATGTYVLGVALLGLVDDTFGTRARDGRAEGMSRPSAPRGLRGHGRALLRGELSTGAIKAGGSLGLALLVTGHAGMSTGRWLLATAVLVLATNALNLLDLRPGRASKTFAAIAVGLTLASGELLPLWTLGLFVGPVLVAGVYDLREQAMLGDTGANALGGLAGLWLIATLSPTGQLVALALLLAITLYGELYSISTLVQRLPLLRALDSWGRPS